MIIEDDYLLASQSYKPYDWTVDNMREVIMVMQLMTPDLTAYVADASGDSIYRTTATNECVTGVILHDTLFTSQNLCDGGFILYNL